MIHNSDPFRSTLQHVLIWILEICTVHMPNVKKRQSLKATSTSVKFDSRSIQLSLCAIFVQNSDQAQSAQFCSQRRSFQKHVCWFYLTFSAYCTAKLKLNNILSPGLEHYKLLQWPSNTFCITESSVVVFVYELIDQNDLNYTICFF